MRLFSSLGLFLALLLYVPALLAQPIEEPKQPGEEFAMPAEGPAQAQPAEPAEPAQAEPQQAEPQPRKPDGSITMPPEGPAQDKKKDKKKGSSAKKKSEAFAGSELLVGRFVKQPTGAKRFSVGINLQFAPMNMVLGSQRDTFIEGTVGAACGGDATCVATAEANMDQALSTIAEIPEEEWNLLTNVASDDQALDQALGQLSSQGVISAQDAESVQTYTQALPDPEDRKAILGATRLLAKQDTTSMLLEPNMEINFSFMSLNVRVPIAMMMFEDETKYHFGNITVDTKFGGSWGSKAAAFGIGGGVSVYAPTGTGEASSMALADLWFGPKFMHGYLTAAPYFAMGFDSYVLSLQAHGEVVSQHYVLGEQTDVVAADQLPTHVMYGKYGAGVVVMPHWPISLIGEINGLVPMVEATPYNALFGIAGVQLKLLWLKAAVAGQFPIIAPEPEDLGSIGGVSLGELASYSIIARGSFVF